MVDQRAVSEFETEYEKAKEAQARKAVPLRVMAVVLVVVLGILWVVGGIKFSEMRTTPYGPYILVGMFLSGLILALSAESLWRRSKEERILYRVGLGSKRGIGDLCAQAENIAGEFEREALERFSIENPNLDTGEAVALYLGDGVRVFSNWDSPVVTKFNLKYSKDSNELFLQSPEVRPATERDLQNAVRS